MTSHSETNQPQTQASTQEHGGGHEGEGGEHGRQAYMSSAVEQAGKLLRNLGRKARSVAESLREEKGPSQRVSRTVERVANKLESSADYLAKRSSGEIGSDLSDVVKRYPLRILGVSFGVGLLVGAVLRRRRA